MIHHKIYQRENREYSFDDATMLKVKQIISHYPEGRQKSALLPILHIAQEKFGGSLNADIMDYVAQILQIQPIEVYEVATFYTQYHIDKVGKYVFEVCQTGPCAICGGEDILDYLQQKLGIKIGETTVDGMFTIKAVECLGGCGYAPVMQVNTDFHEHLTKEKIDILIAQFREEKNSKTQNRWQEKFC